MYDTSFIYFTVVLYTLLYFTVLYFLYYISILIFINYLVPLILSRNVCLVFAWRNLRRQTFPFQPLVLHNSRRWLRASWWSCLLNAHPRRQRVRGSKRMYKTFMYLGWTYIIREKVDCKGEELPFRLIFLCLLLAEGWTTHCRSASLLSARHSSVSANKCVFVLSRGTV